MIILINITIEIIRHYNYSFIIYPKLNYNATYSRLS
jgi:hypothetical protein